MIEILPVPLILESGQSSYVNVLAARADNKDCPAMKAGCGMAESKKFILVRFTRRVAPAF